MPTGMYVYRDSLNELKPDATLTPAQSPHAIPKLRYNRSQSHAISTIFDRRQSHAILTTFCAIFGGGGGRKTKNCAMSQSPHTSHANVACEL